MSKQEFLDKIANLPAGPSTVSKSAADYRGMSHRREIRVKGNGVAKSPNHSGGQKCIRL